MLTGKKTAMQTDTRIGLAFWKIEYSCPDDTG